jgi:2-keto-4-pentenoate hydratase/2-oxohepta-3-ene-1,7-dioic acid hydratase in catechol pathway
MKIIRFLSAGREHFGRLHDDGHTTLLEGDPLGGFRDTGKQSTVDKLLAPIVPRDILCIGLNYKQHAAESNAEPPAHPVLFLKNSGTLQNPGDPIVLPRKLRRADALSHVLGYTCANDVSARDWQRNGGGGQWCRGKTFATFCPLGPAIVTTDEITDPNRLAIRTILNGQTLQDWNTSDMIFDVPTLIEFLSASMILNPGTVILTGTPHGVGFARKPPVFLKAGDSVTIDIENIGQLTNPVVEEAAA